MKRYIICLLTVLMALCSIFALAACDENLEQLSAPTDLRVAGSLRKFRWSEVENASGYQVEINGEQHTVATNVFDFDEITEPGLYTFKVLAKGDGEIYGDSEWAYVNYRVVEQATEGLHYTHIPNAYTVSRGSAVITGRLVIPQEYNGYPVTQIDDGAFTNCVGITEVSIPTSITYIGQQAFSGCTALTGIAIPDSVETLGANAFYGCEALEEIRFPNREVNFGRDALTGTAWMENKEDGLVYVGTQLITYKGEMPEETALNNIADTTTTIEEYAFWEMPNLKSVVLPDSITRVKTAAFGASGIEEIQFSKSMSTIEMGLFVNCKNLKSIQIPEHIKEIGQQAFAGSALESIDILEGLEKIGPAAFQQCVGLTSVQFPSTLVEIGESAFIQCSNLETITFDVLQNKSALKLLGDNSFLNCTSLTTINYMGTYEQWRRITKGVNWDCDALMTMFGAIYSQRAYTISCIDKTVEVLGDSQA